MQIDKAGTSGGRPFKEEDSRYNTFTDIAVQNGPNGFNGIDIGYYTAHVTFNNPVVTGNQSCAGCGGAGYNSFGNFNQYITLNNPTITGNGNLQVMQYGGITSKITT